MMEETQPGTSDDPRMAAAPGWIALARHGRPRGDRSVRINWRDYEHWWAEYDRSGLIESQQPPERLIEIARQADVIFASTLPRAIETAEAVAGGKAILKDPVFIEAPMPPPKLWGKRRPTNWGVWARISWWLGVRDGQESRQQAELRAEAAVATLSARALRGERVLVCAHGWFNRMMRPVLYAQGWRCVEDHGDAYWMYRRYERKRTPRRAAPERT